MADLKEGNPMPTKRPFADALDALLLKYRDEDPEDIIGELEIKLHALHEDPEGAMGKNAGVEPDEEEEDEDA
jgi:hypothetical protein